MRKVPEISFLHFFLILDLHSSLLDFSKERILSLLSSFQTLYPLQFQTLFLLLIQWFYREAGKKFVIVGDIEFEMKTGEIIYVLLKSPTGYCEGLELEKNEDNLFQVPFSSVIAVGDYIVISEEDII